MYIYIYIYIYTYAWGGLEIVASGRASGELSGACGALGRFSLERPRFARTTTEFSLKSADNQVGCLRLGPWDASKEHALTPDSRALTPELSLGVLGRSDVRGVCGGITAPSAPKDGMQKVSSALTPDSRQGHRALNRGCSRVSIGDCCHHRSWLWCNTFLITARSPCPNAPNAPNAQTHTGGDTEDSRTVIGCLGEVRCQRCVRWHHCTFSPERWYAECLISPHTRQQDTSRPQGPQQGGAQEYRLEIAAITARGSGALQFSSPHAPLTHVFKCTKCTKCPDAHRRRDTADSRTVTGCLGEVRCQVCGGITAPSAPKDGMHGPASWDFEPSKGRHGAA